MADVLFIIKDKDINLFQKQVTGLVHAALANAEYLRSIGIKAEAISIPDANFLDSLLKQHQPKIVIAEAVWIQPSKFKTLLPANEFIKKFIIRIHSDFAYFAIESVGFNWMFDSLKESSKIMLAGNCYNFAHNMQFITGDKFLYLPNLYEKSLAKFRKEPEEIIRIGCFGAIRMMKNHLTQAVAAIRFAEEKNKILYFHINELVSDAGSSVLNNLKELFNRNGKHKLIIEPYRSGIEYDNLIRYMDVGMQLSFTESFNIVAANFVCNGVPIVVGNTVEWMPRTLQASYTNIDSIVERLNYAYTNRNNSELQNEQYLKLVDSNNRAKDVWDSFIKNTL